MGDLGGTPGRVNMDRLASRAAFSYASVLVGQVTIMIEALFELLGAVGDWLLERLWQADRNGRSLERWRTHTKAAPTGTTTV